MAVVENFLEYVILGYDEVQFGIRIPGFRRVVVAPSSGRWLSCRRDVTLAAHFHLRAAVKN
jgi:hypothetical protein